MANGNRNILAGIGGLTQGLFRGVTTGIGLQQRQQALDREKLESELGLFNVISKLPDGPFKKASMGRFLPRIGFSKDSTDLLLKANEEEQGYLNRALQNIMEQLPEGMGARGFKDLVGRLTPEQILKLVDVGLKVEKFKSETASTKLLGQIGAGGFGGAVPAEPQQPTPQGGIPGTQAPTSPFDQRIANLDMAIAKATAIGTDDALKLVRVLQSQRDNLAQDKRRFEGLSPKELQQRLDIARQTGAEAVARQPIPTETAKQLSELNTLLVQMDETENLYNPKFVGPVKGRIAGAKEATVGLDPREVEFRATVRDMQDALLRARSGAQINEQEYRRLLRFLPDITNPPDVFRARLNRFRRAVSTLAQEKRKMVGTSRGEAEKQEGDIFGGFGLNIGK